MNPLAFPRFRAITAALLGLSMCAGAQTVSTDPVGFMTLPVNAAGAAGARAMSFRALGLARPVDFQGVASSVSINALNSQTPDSISATNPGWTTDQFNGANG